MITEQNNTVNSESAKHQTWMKESDLVRTLLQGTKGMKLAGKKYLSQNILEPGDAYNVRLENTTLLNAFKKTASFLGGQVFQRDIIFSDGVNQRFKDLSTDIDTTGNNLNVFAKRVFNNGIGKGVALIFVDSPKVDGKKTVKEEKEENIRPYFKEINPENVIGWRVDEQGFLEQVRIRENVEVPDGDYGSRIINRIRVLKVGAWELHEINANGSTSEIDSGEFSQNVLPLVAFIPGEEKSVLTGESPLIDLAELNLSHWRSTSAQTNILNVGRVPLLFTKMVDIEKLPVATSTMINSDDENADMKYVEITGAAIAAGQTDLSETEAKMALYGLQQLIQRSGGQTATEKALTSAESNSSLGTWSTEFEDVLISAFMLMGGYLKIDFPIDGLTLNKEYNFGVSNPNELNSILKSHEQGVISARGAFEEFRRRGTYNEHLSFDDMEADKEKEERDRKDDLSDLTGSAFGNE